MKEQLESVSSRTENVESSIEESTEELLLCAEASEAGLLHSPFCCCDIFANWFRERLWAKEYRLFL